MFTLSSENKIRFFMYFLNMAKVCKCTANLQERQENNLLYILIYWNFTEYFCHSTLCSFIYIYFCHSKLECLSFFVKTQKEIFWRMLVTKEHGTSLTSIVRKQSTKYFLGWSTEEGKSHCLRVNKWWQIITINQD